MPAADLDAYIPRLLAGWTEPTPGFRQTEGTLVYADVSGFTRLTERLSRRGKVGAEEMVATISDVWEALLTAEDGDGDVLKFAGDALILFYSGEDHAARACQAALALQRRLGEVGRIESHAGAIRLRMSVGIHAGVFHFFVVGDDHLELMVLGEAATTTVDLEATAKPGQVLVSPDTADRCPGIRLGNRIGPGVVVRSVPSHAPLVQPVAASTASHHRFVPPLLRHRLGTGEQEHRRATVAFAQLGGIDALLEQRGPAETFDRVQAFSQGVMAVLDDLGVLLTSCDLARDGAVVMLTSGVPDTSGDDEARMLRVVRRIVDLDFSLDVRAGVNAGNVFVGEVGPRRRRAYVTMGDTTNLAARVMARAPWGEALATVSTLEPLAGRFEWRPVEPFQVKGKQAPIEAAIVDRILSEDPTLVHSGPLIGRGEEIDAVLSELAVARSGTGRVVEIVGKEGTGKSRLVAEIRSRADDLAWLVTRCDPFEHTSAYHAARSALRQALDIPLDADPDDAGLRLTKVVERWAPHVQPWLPLLAVPLGATVESTSQADEVGERFRRVRTQQVVVELLESLPPTPAVVVIEDASHMDDASAEMVAELLGRISSRPWLAIITRTEDTTGLHAGRGYPATSVPLLPLSTDQASELAGRLAEATPVAPHLLSDLVDRSGGNPLFLAELVARAGTGNGDMPLSVEGIISSRIDALSPSDRRTLRFLSVLGDHFRPDLIDETLADLGVVPHDDGLWDRLAGFVVHEDGELAFVNPLVRQAAYEGLPYAWRRQIHSRLADVSTAGRNDQLPLHLARAERWGEAWTAAREAADRARGAGANAVAGELYQLALEAARHLDPTGCEVAAVAGHAGQVWERVGVPERALEAYTMAISATDDPADKVRLAGRRAAVHEDAGRYPQALGQYSRAIAAAEELADSGDRHRCLGELHVGYASTRFRQGRADEAIQHANQAASHSEEVRDRPTLAYAHHLLDRIHTAEGERSAALAHRDAALPIFAELGDLAAQGTVLHDLAADAHRDGRLAEATWLYERAIDARTRAGDVVRAAATVNALGEVEVSLGKLESAQRRFGEALRTWRGARSPEGIAVASRNLGLVSWEEGKVSEAIAYLEESQQAATDIGAESLLPATRLALARALLARGRAVEGWEAATTVTDTDGVGPAAEVAARQLRAQALTATGGQERARAELTRALELAEAADLEDASTIRDHLAQL